MVGVCECFFLGLGLGLVDGVGGWLGRAGLG